MFYQLIDVPSVCGIVAGGKPLEGRQDADSIARSAAEPYREERHHGSAGHLGEPAGGSDGQRRHPEKRHKHHLGGPAIVLVGRVPDRVAAFQFADHRAHIATFDRVVGACCPRVADSLVHQRIFV